jgi:hypothetical protein
MRTHRIALAAALGLAIPAFAGELDREFKGSDVKVRATATAPPTDLASTRVSGTELDEESPTQAWRRGGWGGHYGGWGHGWGGHYHGGGYYHGGWGHGWGYGHVGYHRSYYGFYGASYWPSSYYYRPYYSYYSPVYAYSYYPTYGYGYSVGLSYGW